MTRKLRKIHRLLGLFIGLQILFWSVSGLFFSWNNIEKVRGENLSVKREGGFLQDPDFISPSRQIARFVQENPQIEMIDQLTLRAFMGKAIYEIWYQKDGLIHYALADLHTGQSHKQISEDLAIAQADFSPEAPVLKVDFLEETTGASEYRGRPLPAYRVEFDHSSQTRIYISAERGLITARRNTINNCISIRSKKLVNSLNK